MINVYDLGNGGIAILEVEIRKRDARIAELEEQLESLTQRVKDFSAQLDAWGYEDAAKEVREEILGGNVNAPDYYALRNRVTELEQQLAAAQEKYKELLDAWFERNTEIAIAHERDRWIPVTERLPEKEGEYLCKTKNTCIVLYYRNGFYYSELLTHWRKLPDPPQAKE